MVRLLKWWVPIARALAWLAVVMLLPPLLYAQSSLPFTFHAGATATGNGTVMQADYFSAIHVQIEGTFAGVVVFEGKTKDASGYELVQCANRTDQSRSTNANAPGYWDCPGGAYNFRVRVSAYTSGTIVVTGTGTTAVSSRGGGTAQGLDANFDIQSEINGATTAKPLILGNGTQGVEIFGDPTMGSVVRPKPLGDSPWRCWTNFNCVIRDEQTQTNILVIDPNAGGTGIGTVTLSTDRELVVSNHGMRATASDSQKSCSGGVYRLYADASDAKWKKCENGTVSDLDTGGSGGSTLIRRTTDSAPKNANVTLASDGVLLFPIGTSGFTTFTLFVNYSSSTTADFKFDFSVPAGAAGRWNLHGYPGAGVTSCGSNVAQSSDVLTATSPAVGGVGVGAQCSFTVAGYVLSGGTAGSVHFRWAQNASDATNTVVHAGSFVRYQTD